MEEKKILLQFAILGVLLFSILSIMGSFSFSKESERLYNVQKNLLESMDNSSLYDYIRYFEQRRLNITAEQRELMIEAFEKVKRTESISEELKERFEEILDERGIAI